MNNKLVPCNVCGGEVMMEYIGESKYTNNKLFFICCLQCGQRVICGQGFAMESKEDANRRIEQFLSGEVT